MPSATSQPLLPTNQTIKRQKGKESKFSPFVVVLVALVGVVALYQIAVLIQGSHNDNHRILKSPVVHRASEEPAIITGVVASDQLERPHNVALDPVQRASGVTTEQLQQKTAYKQQVQTDQETPHWTENQKQHEEHMRQHIESQLGVGAAHGADALGAQEQRPPAAHIQAPVVQKPVDLKQPLNTQQQNQVVENTGRDGVAIGQTNGGVAQEQPVQLPSIYDYTVKNIDKQDVSLSQYRGKVVLIVNVASQCGYTERNYIGLQALYSELNQFGFEILGFPCNQFGSQEPGTCNEIKEFTKTMYNVTFPLFDKIEVNGDNTAPLYQYLKNNLPTDRTVGTLGQLGDIRWNFFKFLIDKRGHPVAVYDSNLDDNVKSSITTMVQRLLACTDGQQWMYNTGNGTAGCVDTPKSIIQ